MDRQFNFVFSEQKKEKPKVEVYTKIRKNADGSEGLEVGMVDSQSGSIRTLMFISNGASYVSKDTCSKYGIDIV